MDEYTHFVWGENKLCFPDHEFIIKLDEPRVFIKYRLTAEFMYADYDTWLDSLADVQWIDGRPDKSVQEEILTRAWNYLCLEERKLEEDFDEMDDDDGY